MADELVLDLTNYKDTVGNYVEPGKYVVVVEDAELGESSNKKTPQLTLWLRVIGGDHDGSTLVENLYLTDGSKFRVVGFLQAVNIPTPKSKVKINLRTLISKRLVVIVEDDTYNNRLRARVSGFERLIAKKSVEAAGAVDDLEGLEEFAGVTDAGAEEEVSPVEEDAPAEAAPEAVDVTSAEDDDDEEPIDLDDLDL